MTDYRFDLSVLFCSLANIVGSNTANARGSTLLSYVLIATGSPALLCVLGNHLLIHLKEASEAQLNEGVDPESNCASTVQFARMSKIVGSACKW